MLRNTRTARTSSPSPTRSCAIAHACAAADAGGRRPCGQPHGAAAPAAESRAPRRRRGRRRSRRSMRWKRAITMRSSSTCTCPASAASTCCEQLRVMEAGGSRRTPVLVLSADVTPESIRRCEQAGARGVPRQADRRRHACSTRWPNHRGRARARCLRRYARVELPSFDGVLDFSHPGRAVVPWDG